MARAYSLDLRERVFGAWQRGEGSQRVIAARFGVSERFVRDVVRRQRESGGVAAKAHGGGRTALATRESLAALEAQVAQHNDGTVAEHRAGLAAAGFTASRATVGRWLLQLRLTRKKRRSKTTRPTANASKVCVRSGRSKPPGSGRRTSCSSTRAGSTAP